MKKNENNQNIENTSQKELKNKARCYAILDLVLGLFVFVAGLVLILKWNLFFYGIPVALVGCLSASLCYTIYQNVLSKDTNQQADKNK